MWEKKGEWPPCEECLPELWDCNKDSWQVYAACNGQFIMGFGGAVALNHLAVWKYMDEYQIEDRVAVFEKVMAVSNEMIKKMHDEAKMRQEQEKMRQPVKRR